VTVVELEEDIVAVALIVSVTYCRLIISINYKKNVSSFSRLLC